MHLSITTTAKLLVQVNQKETLLYKYYDDIGFYVTTSPLKFQTKPLDFEFFLKFIGLQEY